MYGVRDASGLTGFREGSHFLILREKPDTLEVVEILHGRMNLDAHLERLGKEGHHSSPSRNRSTSSEHSGRIASG